MDVCFLCLYVVLYCVGKGLCDGLITRPEESYRVSVCVCDKTTFFGLCPSSQVIKTQRFGSWLGCPVREASALKGTQLSRTPSFIWWREPSQLPKRCVFYNLRRWTKSKNVVFSSIIHHRQNPVELNCMCVWSQKPRKGPYVPSWERKENEAIPGLRRLAARSQCCTWQLMGIPYIRELPHIYPSVQAGRGASGNSKQRQPRMYSRYWH
jgi:hypothetical protein